jgi:hypothetical protein
MGVRGRRFGAKLSPSCTTGNQWAKRRLWCALWQTAMNAEFWLRMAIAIPLIVGVYNALGHGQILSRIGDLIEALPPPLSKPLGMCMPCMASVYGSAIWFLTGGDLWQWPLFVLSLSGIMRLTSDNLIKG